MYLFQAFANYAAALAEQKERAFIAWRKSGYRDTAAHDRFIALFEQLQAFYFKHGRYS